MPLPTTQDVKDFLRIQTAVEDTLIGRLLTQAIADLEDLCSRSFTHDAVVWYDDAETLRQSEAVTNLQLRHRFVNPNTIVVKDSSGVVVDPTTYVVRLDRGQISGNPGVSFAFGPYTIACDAGFDCSPTYATRELPMISTCILHYVAWLYQQRTIGASNVKSAGSTVTYVVDKDTGLPIPVARAIRRLRGIVFARGFGATVGQ
jgi:uncharacterized phiE125 gp8 family phage protein